ncbi:MAG TPA: hypothetical protein VM260_08425, partial [Pirellula sp.]|nr:hypothetical protein [Pirellula sp.]
GKTTFRPKQKASQHHPNYFGKYSKLQRNYSVFLAVSLKYFPVMLAFVSAQTLLYRCELLLCRHNAFRFAHA